MKKFNKIILSSMLLIASFTVLVAFKTSLKSKSTSETISCYGNAEEYGEGYLRCNAKVKDVKYRIRCSNGKFKTYFYNPVFNSGCLFPDQIGYIGLDDLTKTTLGTDYVKL
jgi:hypothetical protein